MQCIACGNEVPNGSPAPNVCSVTCADALANASLATQVPEDVKALLREFGKHTANCPRRIALAATCTCSLARHVV